MLQTVLVSLWAGICGIDDSTTQMLRRPLPICAVTGLIMGDLALGLLIGATLEIMWMGIGNVGAYAAPDIVTGSAIATALAITSGGGLSAAVALAVPTSLLSQQLLVLFRIINCSLNAWAMRMAEKGDLNKTLLLYVPSFIMIFCIRAIPTFLAVQFGSGIIERAVEALPDAIMSGLSAAGGILPAVGISLLMLMMLKSGKMWVFLLAGFVLSAYMGLDILPIVLLSLPLALLYDHQSEKRKAASIAIPAGDIEEGGYDL